MEKLQYVYVGDLISERNDFFQGTREHLSYDLSRRPKRISNPPRNGRYEFGRQTISLRFCPLDGQRLKKRQRNMVSCPRSAQLVQKGTCV